MFKKLSVILLFPISLVACSGASMKPHYSKSVVQPVVVKKVSEELISIRYKVFPETTYYSNGMNFLAQDGTLRLYIERCGIKDKCEPMAKTLIPLDNKWEAEVQIPYHNEKVILVHADQEEQIYP